ncbi:MAG TPA: alpha/beta fold hydrolase [Ignavibacteriales bacterium]|nr:alpha/beta fold hydrolase [Ignavibacteriales bacterium]HOL80794.1 alpha/beta fold hydrolase [Ignavibacteriales bacterium]HOM66191.1 alpha/beta fold hydrolase [Ignavibacteriales bacterium]HPP33230.1 alpha/beta fold hydrolase [Ignavibacteriales bacterium]HRR17905.1 alpha/beta fold hydrolase [Ignavibacteriales bacterium]
MKKLNNGIAVYDNENIDKQSIIFLHGYPFNHTMWDAQADYLNSNYRVIRYDLRGLGNSEVGDGQYTMEMMVDDLFYLINELQLDKPVVCGLSMGGYITFRALERDFNTFKGAILCDTHAFADDTTAKLRRQGTIKQINEEGLLSFVKSFVTPLFGHETKTQNQGLIDKWINICSSNSPIGVKGCQIAMLSRTETFSALKSISIPVLCFGGNDDVSCPPKIIKEFADEFPKSDFAIVPRAGHMSPIENPEFVNVIIENFLKNLA